MSKKRIRRRQPADPTKADPDFTKNRKECLMHKYAKNGEKNKPQNGFEQQLETCQASSNLLLSNLDQSRWSE